MKRKEVHLAMQNFYAPFYGKQENLKHHVHEIPEYMYDDINSPLDWLCLMIRIWTLHQLTNQWIHEKTYFELCDILEEKKNVLIMPRKKDIESFVTFLKEECGTHDYDARVLQLYLDKGDINDL